jgi:plasmid stabilization system protein ParE
MSRYVLGRDAEEDLHEIWRYVADDSVEAADRLISTLFQTFGALAQKPGMGHKREDLTEFPVLFWPVGNYLVIYRAKKSDIQIVAVVHGKRDVPSFLRRRVVGQ